MELVVNKFSNEVLDNLNFDELDFDDLKQINGGEPASVSGAAALAVGCGLTIGVLLIGVGVGLACYYTWKYIRDK
ncbi:Blp family class II bacteriocin [Arthrospiribacter ruber]|uniref:Uncharacterized protein n=1 Tax=Arthrospiribacter ruber TaxID=2487934 RepID=A0A951IU92_9BACT|nr:Blp family class II bacteriocin [Arthrospiribacter ruber]MBW3466261.1 hypothetical protein [Arthrospiribacter ruber]